MVALVVTALFASAALLFWGELLTGKLLLPALGGAPQVFVTSLLVFQALLLAGYAMAAWLTRGRVTRARLALHVAVLVAALVVGRPALPTFVTESDALPPIVRVVLGVLAIVGAPFFALAVHAPLLQRWLSLTTSARGRDPYFLYVASNAGSFVGLLAFPLVLEPTLALDRQADVYFALTVVVALVVSALLLRVPLAPVEPSSREPSTEPSTTAEAARAPLGRVIALGALPALHLGAVTLTLSLDLAAVPLLWVLPLAAYLASFIVAFSSSGAAATRVAARALPFTLVAVGFIHATRSTEPALLLLALHLAAFFAGAVVCHGYVAAARPAPQALTRFYLALSLGGAVGGALAAVVAPLVFSSIAEVPLTLALLPLALSTTKDGLRPRASDVAFALVFLAGALALVAIGRAAGLDGALLRLVIGVPFGFLIVVKERPPRLALALAALFVASTLAPDPEGQVLRAERSFFGVHRVIVDGDQKKLFQGTTEHGAQSLDPRGRRAPGAYYHPLGPGGEALARLVVDGRASKVALVGLGSGALAAYASGGTHFTFLEIDPAVARLAESEFTFIEDARGRGAVVDVVIGDGRHALSGVHDVIVLDAFTSGAVPVHLLTREALTKVRDALDDDGVALFHISNRHLDLEAVIARVAQETGFVARTRIDLADEEGAARAPSQWAALAKNEAALAFLSSAWRPLVGGERAPLFTDQQSNLVEVLRY